MTSNELRKAQAALGLTAEDICSEAGIGTATYYRMLRGETVNKNTAKHLADALNRLLLESIHKDEQ